MTDIKATNATIRVVENNPQKSQKKQKPGEASFNNELMRSITAMEKMGSAIDVASKNLESGSNSISNITTNMNDVEKWIDRIHGVVSEISSPEQQQSAQAKQAYKKAGTPIKTSDT